jgi:hypothetical protein
MRITRTASVLLWVIIFSGCASEGPAAAGNHSSATIQPDQVATHAGPLGLPASGEASVIANETRGHLQGIAADNVGTIYWVFNFEIIKTDMKGNVLKRANFRGGHHGDSTYHDGKLYVATNYGAFNKESGAKSWVEIYDGNTLALVSKHEVPELVHGAGGMATDHKGRFIIIGGLPGSHKNNYAYEYDAQMNFVKRHVLPGRTGAGIQTACYWNKSWWFGCMNAVLLKTDDTFGSLQRHKFQCSVGIVGLQGDTFLVARSYKSPDGHAAGKVILAHADPSKGLVLDKPEADKNP